MIIIEFLHYFLRVTELMEDRLQIMSDSESRKLFSLISLCSVKRLDLKTKRESIFPAEA